MKVIEKNEGAKLTYEVNGTRITFDDDLTINLARRQGDSPVHLDICFDGSGALVIGAAAGRSYVAELDIPARQYEQVEETDPATETESTPPVALPLDMDDVTLTLWAVTR